jgi:hypothetical protein
MPNNWKSRWKKKHGDFTVPCVVTGRWLEFSQGGSTRIEAGEVLSLAVMTEGSGEGPKKLCELMVTREDILDVLALIERS